MKRQRSNHTASLAVENTPARQHRPVRCSALLTIGSAVRDLSEVGPRRQPRVHLRPGPPQGRPASHCGPESLQIRKRPVQRKLRARESNGLRMLVS
jgi:hypothetical protein